MSVSIKWRLRKLSFVVYIIAIGLLYSRAAGDGVMVSPGDPAHVTCDVHNAQVVEIRNDNASAVRILSTDGNTVHCDHYISAATQNSSWYATAEFCESNMCSMRMIDVVLPSIYLPIAWSEQ
ncbi:MAG TPA: hypothetical protein PKH77_24430 [Anaerolineae bacterium]|nr:hypothetical protein [Anaerolineae bacterium]